MSVKSRMMRDVNDNVMVHISIAVSGTSSLVSGIYLKPAECLRRARDLADFVCGDGESYLSLALPDGTSWSWYGRAFHGG